MRFNIKLMLSVVVSRLIELYNVAMKIGEYNRGKIVLLTPKACFLDLGADEDIFIPPYELAEGAKKGDEIEVFVYNTSADAIRATLTKPYAVMGDFAALEVTEVTSFGMFLDWGLQKDLFVPARNIKVDLKPGDLAVVKIVGDYAGKGVIGTCLFEDLFESLPEDEDCRPAYNQQVDLIVYGFSRIGIRVIVDRKYSGLLYRSEVFENLRIGETHTGYIKKIRDDGLIDVALQPQGFRASVKDASEIIIDALKSSGGYLPLNDKSSAEDIKNNLLMSKKVFKKTIGGLYKDRKITIEEEGIRLLN